MQIDVTPTTVHKYIIVAENANHQNMNKVGHIEPAVDSQILPSTASSAVEILVLLFSFFKLSILPFPLSLHTLFLFSRKCSYFIILLQVPSTVMYLILSFFTNFIISIISFILTSWPLFPYCCCLFCPFGSLLLADVLWQASATETSEHTNAGVCTTISQQSSFTIKLWARHDIIRLLITTT